MKSPEATLESMSIETIGENWVFAVGLELERGSPVAGA